MSDPSTLRARCPCGVELWDRRAGEWTLKASILRYVDGRFVAKCPTCGASVGVPFLAVVEPPAEVEAPRLGVRRRIVRLTPEPGPA